MKHLMEATSSSWMATEEVPQHEEIKTDLSADVCVVGAGIAGLTAAYLLGRIGQKVVVVDSRRIAAGQTQRTSAHLTNAFDDRYSELEKVHGLEGIRIAAESHATAIDFIEETACNNQIECDFQRVPGYLFVGHNQSKELLEREFRAARRAQLDVEYVPRAPLVDFDTGRCIRFPRQGQFHPLKYLVGLSSLIEKDGGEIYDNCTVKDVKGGSKAKVTTKEGPRVTANAVVVATNSPMNDIYAIHTKQAPYETYCIGLEVAHGSISPALYWDTEVPYHYVRIQPLDDQTDVLIVGGEDHKAGQVTDQVERHGRLEEWARARFPFARKLRFQWSGQVMETIDGCAFIGPNPNDDANVFIATGDSGMGLTHGTIAGMILSELIQGNEHPWEALYRPSRIPIAGMSWRRFLAENTNVAKEYLYDYVLTDSVAVDKLPADAGTVIRSGLTPVAVYRDKNGQLHQCTAICPHLGCIVHWNDLEKVWDCPCHGSRFDALGNVIEAPAISNLKPFGEDPQP